MKYKLISGLRLQYEVELSKENLEEFEHLGAQVQPVEKEKPKKIVKKEEK